MIWQNPLGGAANFFEIIPGNRYAKVVKTKICKFFEIFIDIVVMSKSFWLKIRGIRMYFRKVMFKDTFKAICHYVIFV